MRFIHGFAQQKHFGNWFDKEPPLSKLLECFEVNRQLTKPIEVSAYAVESELEELEAVAALLQNAPATPDKRFGVLVSEADCAAAGIAIDPQEPGTTGIRRVDVRHVNL